MTDTYRPQAILLDLGNVVLDIDFSRVFSSWAAASGADATDLANRWSTDHAYDQHEVGAISFVEYANAMGSQFGIELRADQWLDGWNALFVGVYPQVCDLLPKIARHTPLFAFTNTNPTHQAAWSERYREPLSAFLRIFVSSEMGLRKPDPHSFAFVCEEIGHAPDDVLFIDDSLVNVRGALDAGLQAHHITSEEDVVRLLASFDGVASRR
ncbi:MAG: HAD-IA family hydrolase [Proteobacteria bacterium]|nr:HAD-IA family hydrolase [Pseudomonadota bacterium]